MAKGVKPILEGIWEFQNSGIFFARYLKYNVVREGWSGPRCVLTESVQPISSRLC